MTHDQPQKWARYLYPVQAALNSTVHSAKGFTPFNLLFGRDYTHYIDRLYMDKTDPQPVFGIMQDMFAGQKKAYEMGIKVHAMRDKTLKAKHDELVKSSELKAGDIVFWKQTRLENPNQNKKLQSKAHSPFITVDRSGGTVALKHLYTGKYVKNRVSITQLIRPSHYRQIPLQEGARIPVANTTMHRIPPMMTENAQ